MIEYVVIIVGAGGTGGNFAKEYARYISFLQKSDVSVKTVLVDGDHVERKNVERQPFIGEDVNQNKAVVLVSAIQDTFNDVQISAYPHYIDSVKDIDAIFENVRSYRPGQEGISIPVVIGCVDNHRARQCMHEYFLKKDTIFYFDSANEFTDGEVVFGCRLNRIIVSPDRTYYYPDVLTDRSPSASEQSCGVVNEVSPQHLATNLMAANILLSSVVSLISECRFHGGIVYFDRANFFVRFQPYVAQS